MKRFRLSLPSAALALLALRGAAIGAAEQAPTPVPAGTPVTITVQPPAPTAPPFSIVLHGRHGHVTPLRSGCTHTGGGNIDVAQPSSDTVVITMTGAAVAYPFYCASAATLMFDLNQCFEITFDNPKIKKAKLSMEGRVIGLLRGGKGTASFSDACANVEAGNAVLVGVEVPPHSVSGCENLSVNDHKGPTPVPIVAGKYILHQTFAVTAAAPCALLPCKGPSAEFAPDPALDPLWISYREPFHGAAKKDFGFQVIVKVVEDSEPENGDKAEKTEDKTDREKLPPPKIDTDR
jgi:hypothetical protein